MSGKYIVQMAIQDQSGKILGNEIMYHGENQAFSGDGEQKNEFAAADTIYNFLMQNSGKTLKGSLNFMTFTTTLLLKKTPRLFDPSDLVIQIDDSVIIHPLSMHFVRQYIQEGYRVAINEFQFAPRYLSILDSVHYIKINVKNVTEVELRNTIEIGHSMGKQCIVTQIETEGEYQLALSLEADGLEGSFLAGRMTKKVHSGAYLQSNFFRLMVAVTQDEPDIDEIERLIAMDASLSYGILKLANSAYFALRTETTDIHQAVVLLGLEQLKQWIYLLSASTTDQVMDEGTEVFLKRSFMRATFCANLMRYAKEMPISRSEAYLMGMFSMLDNLIDAPLSEILNEVPVSEEVREALLHQGGGRGKKLYDLVLSYEAADWGNITRLAEELGIPNHLLTNLYFTCKESVNALWEQLTDTQFQHLDSGSETRRAE